MSKDSRACILITGGAGFVGSHIAERYLDEGWDVFAVDDLSKGRAQNLSAEVELIPLDITDQSVESVVKKVRPQLLVHCAAQTSVPRSMERPLDDMEVNLRATTSLVSAARELKVQRFVFFSSGGAVYGDTEEPANEETRPNPMSHYGVHKLAAEYHVALSGLSYANLRPSNIFGPRQRHDQEGGVVSIFIESARTGKHLTVMGDGEQRRDFIYVDDVVDAVVEVAESNKSGVWNVSAGYATSINELAQAVEEISGTSLERHSQSPRAGDVRYSCLDSARLHQDFGWLARTSLRDGLEAMLTIPNSSR